MGSHIDKDIINNWSYDLKMPFTLQTLTKKIESVPNIINRNLIYDFRDYMNDRDLSKNHQINNLKVVISFANNLGLDISFHNINEKNQILAFLDSKKKELEIDPDKRWITTWNYYLNRLKLFFRLLYNHNEQATKYDETDILEWTTPEFVKIKNKRSKRVSPYSESMPNIRQKFVFDENSSSYSISANAFLEELRGAAFRGSIDTNDKRFPASTNKISFHLNIINSNLKSHGVSVSLRMSRIAED